MLKIGLTGGVGAGKSRVLFWMEKEWNVGIIRTDEVAHQIMEPGEEAYVRVVEILGTSVLDREGRINRQALAELIFRDAHIRKTVDGITHPLVWEKVRKEISLAGERKTYSMMVVESALFEPAALSFLDEIWYVFASDEVRIKRLMESRGYSREKCRSILASQRTDSEFRGLSTRVIENNGDWEQTQRALEEIRMPPIRRRTFKGNRQDS